MNSYEDLFEGSIIQLDACPVKYNTKSCSVQYEIYSFKLLILNMQMLTQNYYIPCS